MIHRLVDGTRVNTQLLTEKSIVEKQNVCASMVVLLFYYKDSTVSQKKGNKVIGREMYRVLATHPELEGVVKWKGAV